MTAVLKGIDPKGQPWVFRCRLHPQPGQSRRRLRVEFEQHLADLIASARAKGCTGIVRVKGARYKGRGRYVAQVT